LALLDKILQGIKIARLSGCHGLLIYSSIPAESYQRRKRRRLKINKTG
jgi:hypothetical protein